MINDILNFDDYKTDDEDFELIQLIPREDLLKKDIIDKGFDENIIKKIGDYVILLSFLGVAKYFTESEFEKILKKIAENRYLCKIKARTLKTNWSETIRKCEVYSFRYTGHSTSRGATKKLFFYDRKKNAIRNFFFKQIIYIEVLNQTFSPRWPIEI